MIAYVESNFVLEIALGQEQSASAESLLTLAESGSLDLILPNLALAEPFATVTQRERARRRLVNDIATVLRDLQRSTDSRPGVPRLEAWGGMAFDEFTHTGYAESMKLTMLLKLVPTPEQANALLDTMRAFNAAANFVAERAFAEQTANSFALQRMVYTDVRQTFGLSAQLALLAIHKASGAYRRDKSMKPQFRPDGAITYDSRIMAFKGLTEVSLLTLHGRVRVPFRIGAYQAARMDAVQGQADLIYRTGRWYLAVTLDVPEPSADAPEETLGVDLGIVNLATDSDGEHFSGQVVEQTRIRLNTLRAALQKKGTRSAKRHLKKLSGREAKFKKALAS